jgi:hypothetical protein
MMLLSHGWSILRRDLNVQWTDEHHTMHSDNQNNGNDRQFNEVPQLCQHLASSRPSPRRAVVLEITQLPESANLAVSEFENGRSGWWRWLALLDPWMAVQGLTAKHETEGGAIDDAGPEAVGLVAQH